RLEPRITQPGGAVLILGNETAGRPFDDNLRRAGANAGPEIGQWLSKDGPKTGHRMDRARRREDAGGTVRPQTRPRRAVFCSDPWPYSRFELPLLLGCSGRK